MISDDEREGLHYALDALLNARTTLEKVDPGGLVGMDYYRRLSEPRRELFENASAFLRRVIGPRLHREELSALFDTKLNDDARDTALLATIANTFRSFLPLLMVEGRHEGLDRTEIINDVIQDLMGIYWGDEPRFFSIARKTQGMHKRPYRLAKLRLTALNWDKYLSVVGLSPFERHRIVSDAYKTDWDAIRKWARLVEDQFDLISYPPDRPDRARSEFAENPEHIYEAIRRDGQAYWNERETANSGKHR